MLSWAASGLVRSYWHPIVVVGGVLQTALYCDFFYYYITAKKQVRHPTPPPLYPAPSLRLRGADGLTTRVHRVG